MLLGVWILFFYKYTTAETASKIINGQKLKFTHPKEFNDPFDIYPAIPDKGHSKFLSFIAKERNLKITSFGKKRRDLLKELVQNVISTFRDFNIVVTCFSRSPFIFPMWAHYANNHEGCVLKFNDDVIRNEGEIGLLKTKKVVYSKKRPFIFNSNGECNVDIVKSICLSKDESWSYEEEERAFFLGVSGFYSFNPKQLSEVIMGVKMSIKDKEMLKSCVSEYNKRNGLNIKVREIVLDRFDYKMSIL